VKAEGTVVNVSATGVGIQFKADPAVTRGVVENLGMLAPAPPPPSAAALSAALDGADAAPEVRVGPYALLSLLGKGGMGEVHYARAVEGPRAGQFFALKKLHENRAHDSEAVRLFASEAATLALLDHPHIVKTFEAGVFDGHQCLVMEVVDGRDLFQILRRCKSRKAPLPIDVAGGIVLSLLDALAAVHGATGADGAPLGLVHCDVSPHNLFISRSGDVKLGDFGLVRRAGEVVSDAVAHGRPTYLSPEAIDGQISVQGDLWGAAVTAYQVLTLELPFEGESLEALTSAVRTGREIDPRSHRRGLSQGLSGVLRKALSKSPKRRYASAAEFAQALKRQLGPDAGSAAALAEVVRGLFPAT